MLQDAPGRQNHRIVGVGQLVGRHDASRHQLALAAGGREGISEDNVLARLIGRSTGIGYSRLALQALPGDVVERLHHLGHLAKHFASATVVPVQAQLARDELDNLQILLGLARHGHNRARNLHLAVGVGEGAPLLVIG